VKDDNAEWALATLDANICNMGSDFNEDLDGWFAGSIVKGELIVTFTPYDDRTERPGEAEEWRWRLTRIEN
jgi:hypothetical protein